MSNPRSINPTPTINKAAYLLREGAATASAPLQTNARNYEVSTAAACASMSWSVLELIQGNLLKSSVCAAAGLYFSAAAVNQLGTEQAMTAVKNFGGSVVGLFSNKNPGKLNAAEAVSADIAPDVTNEKPKLN